MNEVWFYVSDKGEVLSNTEFPVTKPLLIIPQIEGSPRSYGAAAVSELELIESQLKLKLYKAVKVKLPEDFFAARDGIIR